MIDTSAAVRFSIRPHAGAWRWTTFDARGVQRGSGLVATKAIAAAMVIRDTCRAQVCLASSLDPTVASRLEIAA